MAATSPEYLATRSIPQTPQDLVGHVCINHRQSRSGALCLGVCRGWQRAPGPCRWPTYLQYELRNGGAALSGYWFAYLPEDMVAEEVAGSSLEQVLDEWSPAFPGYYLYSPRRRQNSPHSRSLSLRRQDGQKEELPLLCWASPLPLH
ncbi:LysR substrate-binding domain-containing protein|uniref:LysR substrate-binding domain-containing protein n=1 Tax=Rhizobium altiplani TaxID=1864509 RepID=UPI0009EAAE76